MGLEGLRSKERHLWEGRNMASEETEKLLHAVVSDADVDGIGDGVGINAANAGMNSITQIWISLESGR